MGGIDDDWERDVGFVRLQEFINTARWVALASGLSQTPVTNETGGTASWVFDYRRLFMLSFCPLWLWTSDLAIVDIMFISCATWGICAVYLKTMHRGDLANMFHQGMNQELSPIPTFLQEPIRHYNIRNSSNFMFALHLPQSQFYSQAFLPQRPALWFSHWRDRDSWSLQISSSKKSTVRMKTRSLPSNSFLHP